MLEYQTVLKDAIKECSGVAANTDIWEKDALFNLVKAQNKKIIKAFLAEFPQSSLIEVTNFFRLNYKCCCIRSEQHKQTLRYSIRLDSRVLPFSLVKEHCPSLFKTSHELQRLNDILFYAIFELSVGSGNRAKVEADLAKILEIPYVHLSRSSLYNLLRLYLKEISDDDHDFVGIYSKRSSVRLLSNRVCSLQYTHRKSSKSLMPQDMLCLLMDAIAVQEESDTEGNRSITRHPAWCYYNMIGDNKCKELGIQCHSTIGCPFFQKAKRLPSGAVIQQI